MVPQPLHFNRFGASTTPPMILPFAVRFWLNELAPHLGQRTSPDTGSTRVVFTPRSVDPFPPH